MSHQLSSPHQHRPSPRHRHHIQDTPTSSQVSPYITHYTIRLIIIIVICTYTDFAIASLHRKPLIYTYYLSLYWASSRLCSSAQFPSHALPTTPPSTWWHLILASIERSSPPLAFHWWCAAPITGLGIRELRQSRKLKIHRPEASKRITSWQLNCANNLNSSCQFTHWLAGGAHKLTTFNYFTLNFERQKNYN